MRNMADCYLAEAFCFTLGILWDWIAITIPMRTYGDIAFRVYGAVVRHMVNILQSIQLLFNVGVILIANGQALSQVSKFRLCYAVCCLVFALAGFFISQVRTLQKYGWFANAAIWMNILVIITTMGVVAHTPPNYTAAGASAGAALGGMFCHRRCRWQLPTSPAFRWNAALYYWLHRYR